MTDHTKEPWLCDKRTVYALNKNGFNIFSAVVQDCHAGNSELEANAHRIVACVNACEGIETDELNAYRVVSAKEYLKIERQRDELLAALEAVQAVADNSDGVAGWHMNGDIAKWDDLLPEIDIAITSVKDDVA